MENKLVFDITPQSWFKILPQYTIFFKIPEKCPKGRKYKGKIIGCKDYRKTGKCKHILQDEGLRIKRRIEQYNKYKIDVLHLARRAGFILPPYGFAFYFYYPMPDYWTKAKKEAFHGQLKMSKPDVDNLEKALYDSLSITDEEVGQVSGHGKFWDKNVKTGRIEILLNQPVYNPFNVTFIDQRAFNNKPKRSWVRQSPFTQQANAAEEVRQDLFLKEDKIK